MSPKQSRFLITMIICATALLGTVQAHAAWQETISIDEIRPGMKGYGLTVFSGTEPEKFGVEVISVVPNFLLRQSIILIRCSHPVTDKAGVIGGMSGSPIYIEGKLAGALAYGWRFHKDPIAGVTPIKDMRAVLKRKIYDSGPRSFPKLSKILSPLTARLEATTSHDDTFFNRLLRNTASRIAPARTPLTMAGFLGIGSDILEQTFSPYGMEPMRGGGAGNGVKDPGKFVEGGAIGVQLIRGDLSATAIGTVTEVNGDDVLAFGHPMFNMGQGFLPVTTAQIHTVIASVNRSNKLGSPLSEIGSLIQDRQACITAKTDRRAPTISMKVRVRDPRGGVDETYHVEMISHRMLTGRMLKASLLNIIQNAASDAADMTAEIDAEIKIEGMPMYRLSDVGSSRSGLAPLISFFRPSTIVTSVLDNPFENAVIESLNFDIVLRYGLEYSTIESAYLTAQNPSAGDLVNLHVRLRSFGGQQEVVTIPIRIPEGTDNQKIQIQVGGGDDIPPVMAAPNNLAELLANVQRFNPPRSIIVAISVPGEGVTLRGQVINELPASAVASLKPAVGVDRINSHRTVLTKIFPTDRIINDKKTISVTVGDRRHR